MLWEFQRDGLLPFERESIPSNQRLPVDAEMMIDLEPALIHEEDIDMGQNEPVVAGHDGWADLPAPNDSLPATAVVHNAPEQTKVDLDDERAQLEAELARIDAEWGHRDATPTATSSPPDAALADLESRLSNIEF